MGESRPIPVRPLFLAPEPRQEGRPEESDRPVTEQCELGGCTAPLPHPPGNEGRVRYCCREHRRKARAERSQARHGSER